MQVKVNRQKLLGQLKQKLQELKDKPSMSDHAKQLKEQELALLAKLPALLKIRVAAIKAAKTDGEVCQALNTGFYFHHAVVLQDSKNTIKRLEQQINTIELANDEITITINSNDFHDTLNLMYA